VQMHSAVLRKTVQYYKRLVDWMFLVLSGSPVVRVVVIAKCNPSLPEACHSLLRSTPKHLSAILTISALTLDSDLQRQNNSHTRVYSIRYYMRKCMYGNMHVKQSMRAKDTGELVEWHSACGPRHKD